MLEVLDEELELTGGTLERDEDELDGTLELEDELTGPVGAEHSFTPPAVRPPNVASVQAKLPDSTL